MLADAADDCMRIVNMVVVSAAFTLGGESLDEGMDGGAVIDGTLCAKGDGVRVVAYSSGR